MRLHAMADLVCWLYIRVYVQVPISSFNETESAMVLDSSSETAELSIAQLLGVLQVIDHAFYNYI